jgi:hypothetical protein
MRYTATLYGLAVAGAPAIAGCGAAITHSAKPGAAVAPAAPSTTAQPAASSNPQATDKYLVAMAALAFGGIAVEYGHDMNGTALLTKASIR